MVAHPDRGANTPAGELGLTPPDEAAGLPEAVAPDAQLEGTPPAAGSEPRTSAHVRHRFRGRIRSWYRALSEPQRIAVWVTLTTVVTQLLTAGVSAVADVKIAFYGPRPAAASPFTEAPLGEGCSRVPTGVGAGAGTVVNVLARVPGGCWLQMLGYMAPGSELEYLITYKNQSDGQDDDVTFRVDLPDGVRLVSGSTRWVNASHPEGVRAGSDNIQDVGINVGSYAPGANAFVIFRVTLPGKDEAACGGSEFQLVGYVHPSRRAESGNSAFVSAYREC